ncbi:serine/threonine-protein kinase [Alienimonas californiensis]|uniref:Serine/threonine-protein kinase StkP n=1 Tax=Alienimonas californiensis TaxID=2527989 RepID=A0A517P737_9PLAN|nr:serine/threonine-protein kinase [Alienimonas californiensis]QDT15199.1 Serine/threonine-protein kinase StkP [Alienimonas californiensis]
MPRPSDAAANAAVQNVPVTNAAETQFDPSATRPPGAAPMSSQPHSGGRFAHPPESRPLEGYTLKRAIHRGGFGEVYYGLSDGGKEVAMKLLHQHTEIELRGANACLNLNHPNLITIYDIKRDGSGDWWVLMEYAGGPRLADVLEDRGKLPVEEIEHWLRGLTAGLTFLHERGLVHRDLKPANIFAEGGTVKIGDVGLSKFISESRGSEHTKSVGTVYYMAPEIARGKYGRGVDLYALAVMLFEMYTGTVPFDGETPAEILMKHLSAPPDLSPLPPALKPVFARALHKDPEKRTRSVGELEREFRAAVRGHGAHRSADRPHDLDDAAFDAPPPRPAAVRVPVTDGDEIPYADAVWADLHARQRAEEQAERRRDRERSDVERQEAEVRLAKRSSVISWIVIAAIILIASAPRLTRGIAASAWELAILAALGYGVFRLVKWLAGGEAAAARRDDERHDRENARLRAQQDRAAYRPDPAQPSQEYRRRVGAVPVRVAAPPPRPRPQPRPVPLDPEDVRSLSGWRRATEFAGSAAVAGALSAAVAGLVFLTDAVQTVPEAALFGLVTALASWGVLLCSKLSEGRFDANSPRKWLRRYPLFGVGAAVGLAAWGVSEALLIDVPIERNSLVYAAVAERGPLTAIAFVGFFTTLLGLRRWWRHADGYRPKRLRLRTVLLTGVLGLGACLIFGVPVQWGLPWAIGLSVVTQLAAVWTPGRKRPHKIPAAG